MKMLKTKHFRRIVVFLAMIAPAVYLFGSLFSALTGAHGAEVFAEPVYTQEYVDVDNIVDDGSSYRLIFVESDSSSILDALNKPAGFYYRITSESFVLNGFERYASSASTGSLYAANYSESYCRLTSYPAEGPFIYSMVGGNGVFNYPLPWVFDGSYSALQQIYNFFEVGSFQKLVSVPTSEVAENAGAYSDYVFKNFFAKDNFLEQIGKDVLSDNPHGFVPFASFWKYLDENMLHMGDMQLGLMGYGYVYYCCHVLLFDIAFILVTFFLDFIQKVNDKVVGGVD